ncbi:MAG TPA: NAD(P)-binding domain-containing protein [Gemmatimonadales bacterium]
MNIGILGSGDVGRSLGLGFTALGHDVKMGARDAANPKVNAWVRASVASTGRACSSRSAFSGCSTA